MFRPFQQGDTSESPFHPAHASSARTRSPNPRPNPFEKIVKSVEWFILSGRENEIALRFQLARLE
jgi:hypothetical protein